MGAGVSELIPNLEDLRAQLPTDETALDAHEFLIALSNAASLKDVETTVDALVDAWLEVPVEHGT